MPTTTAPWYNQLKKTLAGSTTSQLPGDSTSPKTFEGLPAGVDGGMLGSFDSSNSANPTSPNPAVPMPKQPVTWDGAMPKQPMTDTTAIPMPKQPGGDLGMMWDMRGHVQPNGRVIGSQEAYTGVKPEVGGTAPDMDAVLAALGRQPGGTPQPGSYGAGDMLGDLSSGGLKTGAPSPAPARPAWMDQALTRVQGGGSGSSLDGNRLTGYTQPGTYNYGQGLSGEERSPGMGSQFYNPSWYGPVDTSQGQFIEEFPEEGTNDWRIRNSFDMAGNPIRSDRIDNRDNGALGLAGELIKDPYFAAFLAAAGGLGFAGATGAIPGVTGMSSAGGVAGTMGAGTAGFSGAGTAGAGGATSALSNGMWDVPGSVPGGGSGVPPPANPLAPSAAGAGGAAAPLTGVPPPANPFAPGGGGGLSSILGKLPGGEAISSVLTSLGLNNREGLALLATVIGSATGSKPPTLGGGAGGGGGAGRGSAQGAEAAAFLEAIMPFIRTDANNPAGSLTWHQGADGRWTQNTTLNKPNQDLYNSSTDRLNQVVGGIDTNAKPPELLDRAGYSDTLARTIYDRTMGLQSGNIDEERRRMQARLAEQGFIPGNEGYQREMRRWEENLGEMRNRASMDAQIAAHRQGLDEGRFTNDSRTQGFTNSQQMQDQLARILAGIRTNVTGGLQGLSGTTSAPTGGPANTVAAADSRYQADLGNWNARNSSRNDLIRAIMQWGMS